MYYTLLSVLMNKRKDSNHKSKNFNQHQWDRLVLYIFMIIQRVKYQNNFSCYALINGASTWSTIEGNMDVNLGLCLTTSSTVRISNVMS